jgi:hypothetical protein
MTVKVKVKVNVKVNVNVNVNVKKVKVEVDWDRWRQTVRNQKRYYYCSGGFELRSPKIRHTTTAMAMAMA